MKRILMKFKYMVVMLCSIGVFSSCENFLGTVPLNEIVLENFWENEAEVNSVVMSCYSRMAQGDFLTRLILWGELRSDNVVEGVITGEIPYVNNDQLRDMLEGNIQQDYYIADWSCFYSVINRCNTVLHYAPQVLERDPDFKASEWEYIKAEMLTLRALCYFYLVRSFRDVPLVLEPTLDDSQEFQVPAADPNVVLEQLVKDLQEAELHALKEFPESNYSLYSYTKARVTKQTVWSLLADIYLWMERYDECVAYCEKVIEAKIADAEKDNMNYEGNYPLIANQKSSANNNIHQAFNLIFGSQGNSFESIFEMPFGYNYEDKRDALRSYYGALDVPIGAMTAATFIGEGAKDGNDLYKSSDIRAIEAFDVTGTSIYPIHKYACVNISDNGGVGYAMSRYPNWIFYRLTDVMLMEAEALVERNDSVDAKPADLQKAFDLAYSVYHRANLKGDVLKFSGEYATQDGLRSFVLEERQRELMFEGKRWFDLVRKARREGSNSAMLDLATRKYTSPGTVKSKWIKPDMLYLPIHEDELKVNPLLVQNPEYITDKTITTAK